MTSLRRAVAATGMLLSLAFLTAFFAVSAHAAEVTAPPSHNFLFSLEGFIKEPGKIPVPPPEGEFEDACGVAVDSAGDLYLSDYYHRRIDVYSPAHEYLTQIKDLDPDGPCNLAVDSTGHLYVNHWRRDVVRYTPSSFPPTAATTYGAATTVDFPSSAPGARSTGLALDPATGDLYVDDRTYVAVYGAATLSQVEPPPARTIAAGLVDAVRRSNALAFAVERLGQKPAVWYRRVVPDAQASGSSAKGLVPERALCCG